MENVARVSVLMLDIQDSTPLAKKLGGEAYLAMLPTFREAVDKAIKAHHGGEFQKQAELGDDCIKADFSTPLDAVHCAVDIQTHFKLHSVAKDTDGSDIKLMLHLAVHTCPVASDGRADRSEVPDLARLLTQANNGQILLSVACYDAHKTSHGDMPYKCEKYGGYLFEGIPGEQSVYSLLYDAQYRGAPGTQFIGFANLETANEYIVREDAESAVREKFVQPNGQRGGKYRFVTVFGEGGMGKTRLTINCARRLVGHFPGGVVFVPLAPFTDAPKVDSAAVADAIYSALNLEKTPGDIAEQLFLELKNCPATLLLLDNAESVTHEKSVVAYIQHLLQNVPQLYFIASSRSYLEMNGEAQVDVNEGLTPWEAYQLFRERVRSGFVLPENVTRKEIIVLDGRMTGGGYEIPKDAPKTGRDHELFCLLRLFWLANRNSLSLELIASWTYKYKSIDQLLTEYEADALNLLTEHAGTPSGDAITRLRHQSLEASYLWSWKNLGAEEKGRDAQMALLAAALFADTFIDDAIEAVLGWDDKKRVAKATNAVQNAAFFRSFDASPETRYRMHWQLQAFGRNKKYWQDSAGEIPILPAADELLSRFIDYYDGNMKKYNAINFDAGCVWLQYEWRNVRVAARYAHQIKNLYVSVFMHIELSTFFLNKGYSQTWEEVALEAYRISQKIQNTRVQQVALNNLSSSLKTQGKWDEMEKVYRESLTDPKNFGDKHIQANALKRLGEVYQKQNKALQAERSLNKALTLYHEVKDQEGQGEVLNGLGDLYRRQNKWEEAENAHKMAFNLFRNTNSASNEMKALEKLADIYSTQKRWDKAEKIYSHRFALCETIDDRWGKAMALSSLGMCHTRQQKWADADRAYKDALAIGREEGFLIVQGLVLCELALYCMQIDAFDTAVRYAREGIAIVRQTEDTSLMPQLESVLELCASLATVSENNRPAPPPSSWLSRFFRMRPRHR